MTYPVIFTGAGPGDPELITVKGQRALQEADLIIYAGSLVAPEMLSWAKPEAELVDSAGMDMGAIIEKLVNGYREGKRVVRLHSGDPSIYGTVQEQFDLLDKEGVSYRVIPGVTAATAAAAALKKEYTIPETTQTLIITRAAGRTPVPELEDIKKLAAHHSSLAIYLSIGLLDEMLAKLNSIYNKNTPIVAAYRVSWPDELIIRGTLADIADKIKQAGITRQALIIVSPALQDKPHKASKLYDKDFSHGFREAKE